MHLIALLAGIVTCDADATADEPPMLVNQGLSGSWYEPATSGQGFALEVVPSSNTMVAYWYTYLQGGNGREWYFSQGSINGDTTNLLVYRAEGGVFDQPDPVLLEEVGTLNLTFTDCLTVEAEYVIEADDFSGIIPLQRLTPDIRCESLRAAAHSTFVTNVERWLDAQGLWLFEGCVELGASESHGDERFWFEGATLRFEIEHFNMAGCQGQIDLQEMSFEMTRVGHAMALLDGQSVISNRVVLKDSTNGQEVKQTFYFEQVGDVDRMAHGNFDSGNDLSGYPREFHNLAFEFQPGE